MLRDSVYFTTLKLLDYNVVMTFSFNNNNNNNHRLDTGIVFRIRHYWEIWKMVNGHKSAAHTDSPDDGTGKMCLGRGAHCPSASSYCTFKTN